MKRLMQATSLAGLALLLALPVTFVHAQGRARCSHPACAIGRLQFRPTATIRVEQQFRSSM